MIYFIAWVVIAWIACIILVITLGKENNHDPQSQRRSAGQAHRIDR